MCDRYAGGCLCMKIEREREPPLLQSNNRGAVAVMTQLKNQLASVATLPERLLILIGRIYNTRSRMLVQKVQMTSFKLLSAMKLHHMPEALCKQLSACTAQHHYRVTDTVLMVIHGRVEKIKSADCVLWMMWDMYILPTFKWILVPLLEVV